MKFLDRIPHWVLVLGEGVALGAFWTSLFLGCARMDTPPPQPERRYTQWIGTLDGRQVECYVANPVVCYDEEGIYVGPEDVYFFEAWTASPDDFSITVEEYDVD